MTEPTRPLVMSHRRFRQMLAELHRRGQDSRESGAFLLSRRSARTVAGGDEVTTIFYYDDLDAECLTGGITMRAKGLSSLNQLCREHDLQVLGDIHTHPSKFVQQSRMDATHPMIALPGHIALIAPNYAAGRIRPRSLGAHRLLRGGEWGVAYEGDVDRMFQVRSGLVLALARLLRSPEPTT